jgi:RNA polymerase sigma-70 factor (ECF subfamily)
MDLFGVSRGRGQSNKLALCVYLLYWEESRSQLMGSIATLEDSALIEMTLAGQTESFSVLMNRYASSVRRCIRSIVRNTSDVDDVFQDTFLKAWVHLSAFRFEASFRTWIIRVAVNEALALYRRQRCRPFCSSPANLEALAARCESPDQALARAEECLTVRTAIAKLPKKYQEILTFCDLEELTAQETARHLKSSIPLVKTRRFRARHMLSAALKRKNSNWSGAMGAHRVPSANSLPSIPGIK